MAAKITISRTITKELSKGSLESLEIKQLERFCHELQLKSSGTKNDDPAIASIQRRRLTGDKE